MPGTLRQAAIQTIEQQRLYEDAPNLEVRSGFDKEARTLTTWAPLPRVTPASS
jgi:hypothetical protein